MILSDFAHKPMMLQLVGKKRFKVTQNAGFFLQEIGRGWAGDTGDPATNKPTSDLAVL